MNQLYLFSGSSGGYFRVIPASANSIRCLYQKFQTTGCLCNGRSAGRSRVPEESVRQYFLCSPKKYVRHASHELGDVDYDCVEETGNEALSSSLGAVSSVILVHGAHFDTILSVIFLSLNRRYGIKNCIQICREIVSLICA
jgi:hypothetical protein